VTAPLFFDLAGRGSVVLTGKDRATFLHGLVTNDVKGLAPGRGCAAAFLTAKGKMLAECVVLCEEQRLVLDTPPELAATVEALLRTYLVFNEVTITNETDATHVIHVTAEEEREEAEEFLRRLMEPGSEGTDVLMPTEPHASRAAPFTFEGNPQVLLVRENRTGSPGYDLRVPSSLSEEISSSLSISGARLETPERLEALRIAAGIPRWGAELTEAVLPDEARLRERGFVAENKGCYVGQEIVARIKTYGHVNRQLVSLAVSGGVPRPGEKLFAGDTEAGAVTSAAPLGAGDARALAYVKRDHAAEGTPLTISSSAGTLRASVLAVPLA
jgi:folate-binding protein YgfZ